VPTAPPVNLAGSTLRDPRHLCAFFSSRDKEYRPLTTRLNDVLADSAPGRGSTSWFNLPVVESEA
jgi:hypothetical protein